MKITPKATPSTFIVDPDDRFVETRLSTGDDGLAAPRFRIKKVPEGVTVESVRGKRGMFRISWEGPLDRPLEVVIGAEDKVGVQGVKIRITPRLVEAPDPFPEGAEAPEEVPDAV